MHPTPHELSRFRARLAAAAGLILLAPAVGAAYVGPGAGFALVSSFFVLALSFLGAIVSLLAWPFRFLAAALRIRRAAGRAPFRKVVVLGFDGQDPELTERFMADGLLPNLSRLRDSGSYHRLGTTLPAESPVAWSTFQTGCNPGRHGIFDFFGPDRRTYLPRLSAADTRPPRRSLKLGRYRIPIGRPSIVSRRRSRSFWSVLGERGVFSTILRVPITYPPEKFNGLLLSAMPAPDLLGTQGTFTYFTNDPAEKARVTGGNVVAVAPDGNAVDLLVTGPANPLVPGEALSLRLRLSINGDGCASLAHGRSKTTLEQGRFSPWIPLRFRAGPGFTVAAACRFLLRQTSPFLRLYMSPLNLDPARPALPISHPWIYGVYLSRAIGRFCTLGMCEDTWALNEGVLDEDAFLGQCLLFHEEREKMFFDALRKTRFGALACVFDITDRMQHMFWRYLEPDHPANAGRDAERHRDAIRELYVRMDGLVGRTMEALDDDALLIVMSDHGFKSFRRGVNLNTWLRQRGFLVLKDGTSGAAEWLADVDWERTKAFAMGLGGIYLNVAGREARGLLRGREEVQRVKGEIAAGLRELVDLESGEHPVQAVYDTAVEYSGPYRDEAPDLVAGFRPGYRVSWESATGSLTPEVLEPNVRRWSGDHCIDPRSVPGILFCNRTLEGAGAGIIDIAPTVLEALGVAVPAYMEGRSLLRGEGKAETKADS